MVGNVTYNYIEDGWKCQLQLHGRMAGNANYNYLEEWF